MADRYITKTIAFFLIIFLGWVSFVPEPWQVKYGLQVKYALFILLILSLYRHKFNFAAYFFEKSTLALWIYLFLISLNIPFAQDKKLALGFYTDFSLSIILIFFLFKNEIAPNNIKKIFYALYLCAAAVCLFGFLEIFTKTNIIYTKLLYNDYYERCIQQGRMMSTLIHPNILGAYLVASLPLAHYFYKHGSSLNARRIKLFIFLLIITALILTFSRGTYIAILLTVTVWLILKKEARWAFFLWALVLFFSFIFSFFSLHWEFRRLCLREFWVYITYGYHRLAQYSVTFSMLKAHPFVGIGLQHYRPLFNVYSSWRLPYEVMIPDSIYLMHLAETGLVGLSGFILLLLSFFKEIRLTYRRLSGDNKALFLAIILGFLGLLFNMAFFDGFLWRTPFYLFCIFAATAAGSRKAFLIK
ncbi:MAG: O-antigen ligase family protein [Candidatus Omnitrophota bacterium]|jgi:O-antigen ligase